MKVYYNTSDEKPRIDPWQGRSSRKREFLLPITRRRIDYGNEKGCEKKGRES